jgi:hypothetical protein
MRFIFLLFCCSMATAGDAPIAFTVDLTFGADETEDVFLWSSGATSVSVDKRGHMFVSDPAENRVLEFDTEGGFVRLVTSEGKGPGEFQNLLWFSLLADGSAMGYELVGGNTAKLHYFDKNIRFREASQKQLILELATISPTGRHLAGFFVDIDPENRQVGYRTGVFNTDLEEIKPVTRETGPLHDRSRFQEPSYWAERLGQNMKRALKGEGVFHFAKDGTLYSAVTNQYEITAWNPDLKTPKKVYKRDYKPIVQTEAQLGAMIEFLTDQLTADPFLARIITPGVMKRAIELSEPPPVKNPVFGMVTMEDGTLLVVHNVDLITRDHLVDVFTPEGDYRGQITFPDHAVLAPVLGGFLPRMTFRNGYAYTFQTDEIGDNRVVRYRYRSK